MEELPTKPYLLRALYQWCVDNGYTPYLAVKVDSRSQVPLEYVRDGEITLNISPTAVHKLQMGNDIIEFSARFAGVGRQILVPVACVHQLYSKETKQGMTFEVEAMSDVQNESNGQGRGPSNEPGPAPATAALPAPSTTEPTRPSGGKPQLRRIK